MILIGFNTVVIFPPFRIPRASIHCVIMSLRALHLLVAVHALVAHLGQSPRCVTSADISDFQEPSSSTGRRELTILLWKLTTREFGIEVRGSILRSIFREAHYCQQVEAQLGPHCGGWFGLNLQKRFPHSTWKVHLRTKRGPVGSNELPVHRAIQASLTSGIEGAKSDTPQL